jgi:hypothetical protein
MESMGAADMAFVVVPHPLGMIKEDEARAKADAAFADILKAATEWKPERTEIPGVGDPAYPAERIKFTGTYEELNQMFQAKGWSLGIPIIPPTVEAVEAMLKGTSHAPDEIVWIVPPRMGNLTVELVAALGVMAGCKPEQMPLLLAIVEGLSSDVYSWRGQTTTTHPAAPLILVNGPIAEELGIASSSGAFAISPNINIGFFVNLVGDIVGGSKSPSPDKTDQGWPGNVIAAVAAENEEANPWEPYHVEEGFQPTDSVVTVAGGSPPGSNADHASNNAKDLVENLASMVMGQGTGIGCLHKPGDMGGEGFLLLSPEHTATIFGDGWTKDDIRQALADNTLIPYGLYPGKPGGKSAPPFTCDLPADFGIVTDETMVPLFADPSGIRIAVVGGPGKHSQFWDGAFALPVSVLVDTWR